MPDRPDLFDDVFGLPDDDLPGMPRYTRTPHPMPCQPLGVLLRYANENDTSITPRRRARIGEHVRCCETCQMHLERALDEVLHGGVHEGYGVYDIYKDAYEVHQAVVQRRENGFKDNLHTQIKLLTPPLGPRYPLRRWLPTTASLAVLLIGALLLRPAAVVIHAEELMERAIAYDREHLAGSRQRVRQSLSAGMFALGRIVPGMPRIAPFSEIRDVVDGTIATGMRLVSVREREADEALMQLFAKHRLDWRKPLCLSCYSAWHASLARKRDTVMLTGDMLVLRTTTSEGDLREVTLTFRRDSYRLVRQSFLFEGLGRIVIDELERHQAATANQLAAAASSRPVVDAGTGTLAPTISSRPPAAGDLGRTSRRPPLSRWLDRNFPPSASAARSTFLPEIERRSSSVRQHLIVLQRLASVSASGKLKDGTDADRARVRQEVELQYQAVITHLLELEERLNLLLGHGSRSFEFPAALPADWQRRASTALPHATRLEHRLRRIFTRDDLPSEETQASQPRSARAAFDALWESIHGG